MVSSESRPLPSLAVGMIVADKYRVERVLGSGGMGLVVEARHIELGQAVALKVLHDTALADSDSVQRFFREAQATAALESEHVVRVHDLGRMKSGSPFIVMERLTGRDLADLLDDWGLFSVELAVECVRQAALGLAEAHAANIIHRDIKPSNLFVTRRRNRQPLVKILDFGISKVGARDQVSLTQTRMVVGSPLYMSPEQIRDARTVDERTDIWSLGAILQELLTGLPPFPGDTLPAVCAAIVADEPLPVRRADVTPELAALVRQCLEKDAAKRIQTASELAQRLGAFLVRASASIPPLTFDDGTRPPALPPDGSVQRIKVMANQETLVDSEANRLAPGGLPRSSAAAMATLIAPGNAEPSRPAPTQPSVNLNGRRARNGVVLFGISALVLAFAIGAFYIGQKGRSPQKPTLPGSAPKAPSAAQVRPADVAPQVALPAPPATERALTQSSAPALPSGTADAPEPPSQGSPAPKRTQQATRAPGPISRPAPQPAQPAPAARESSSPSDIALSR